jgi:hypothetical protein
LNSVLRRFAFLIDPFALPGNGIQFATLFHFSVKRRRSSKNSGLKRSLYFFCQQLFSASTAFEYFSHTFAKIFTVAMLKQCTALFLLLATLASTFSKAVIVADFYANQDYIAKNLCVNRNKPMMNCRGRCQLCKRLAHEENQDKSNPDRKPENRNEIVFFEDLSHFVIPPIPSGLTTAYPLMIAHAPIDRAFPFFHPPGC